MNPINLSEKSDYLHYWVSDEIIIFKEEEDSDEVWGAVYHDYLFITDEALNKIVKSEKFHCAQAIREPCFGPTSLYGFKFFITKHPDYAAVIYRETHNMPKALNISADATLMYL